MKKILAFLLLAFSIVSCEKIPNEDQLKEIDTKITDLKGFMIKEAPSGTELKLSAPEFKELNKQGLLQKEGTIMFDKIAVPIKEAADDYIITAVPIMEYNASLPMSIYLNIRQVTYAILCRACLIYRPRVSGTIFAGFTAGVTDGTFLKPAEMIHDISGNIYVIDQRTSDHDIIKKITPAGLTTTFAGTGDVFGRLVGIGINNTLGLLYVSDATSQQVKTISLASPSTITVLAGSGVAGNTDGIGAAASFRFGAQAVDNFGSSETGQGLVVDATGNIFVGETTTSSLGSQLRKITSAGVVTTVPGTHIIATMSEDESALPSGVAINSANELFTTSGSSGFYQGVNRFTPAPAFSRFAGRESTEGINDGTGSAAQFSYPKALSHYAGYLYVADGTNGALRSVSSTGQVITLAGVGHFSTNRFNGSGFLPPLEGSYLHPSIFSVYDPEYFETAAKVIRMDQVGGVTAVTNKLFYVSDYGYNCIWKISIR